MSRVHDTAQQAVEDTGHRVRDKAAEVSQQIKDAAGEKFEEVRSRATDVYNRGRETAEEWEQSLESYVQAKPLQAVLLAAGVGLLLGLIWKRR
jgi:ElaB/YqjD/DUF883 family membrane-anchored ribosome-binding protein